MKTYIRFLFVALPFVMGLMFDAIVFDKTAPLVLKIIISIFAFSGVYVVFQKTPITIIHESELGQKLTDKK